MSTDFATKGSALMNTITPLDLIRHFGLDDERGPHLTWHQAQQVITEYSSCAPQGIVTEMFDFLIKNDATMEVEYYRCWHGNNSDSGTWDTDFIKIPAYTPNNQLDEAVRVACQDVEWDEDGAPLMVGFYDFFEDEAEDDAEEETPPAP
jgi:hypothetical protein